MKAPSLFSRIARAVRAALSISAAPMAPAREPALAEPARSSRVTMQISPDILEAVREARSRAGSRPEVFRRAKPLDGVVPRSDPAMAMDDFPAPLGSYFGEGMVDEGLIFMGYPWLAQLTQRAEYRRPAEVLATEMTRRWIRLVSTGDEDKSEKLTVIGAELKRLNAQDVFRQAIEKDGFFGRVHIYMDTGNEDPDERKMPLSIDRAKIDKAGLVRLKVVEPMWTYPTRYNSTDPLAPDWYCPVSWYVMGTEVHASRLLTIISREVPDILKAAYSFGGLSLSQIAKPYVDNWLDTRQAVNNAITNFSTSVLKTNMSGVLSAGGNESILMRAQLFNQTRENQGLMMLDNQTEEFLNVSMPLSGLDHLQAQAQEHMSAVYGIPLVVLLGITPSGLNASSESEIKVFNAWIDAQQNRIITPPLSKIIEIIQIAKFGAVDPEIGFVYEPLQVMSETEQATAEKTRADTDVALIQAGVLAPHEARVRLASDEDSQYSGLDLTEDPPPPQGEPGDPSQAGDPSADPAADPSDEDPDDEDPTGGVPAPGQPNPPSPAGGSAAPIAGSRPPVARDGVADRLRAHVLAKDRALEALAMDKDHWITTETGSRLLLTNGGVVIGGAGGNLNGKVLSPKSKGENKSVSERESRAAAAASALQNRNRSSAASISQMNKIASNPNPRLLMAAPTMSDGAPVVADLGGNGVAKLTGKRDFVVTHKREIPFRYAVVEADQISASNHADGTKNEAYASEPDKLTAINNGRAAGLVAAYERGNAADYKKAIAKAEAVHGIPRSAILAMKAPVLVRVMDASHVDDHIGDESNAGMTLALSATEQAKNDAARFDPGAVDYDDDGAPSDASVKGFINAMPESERQQLAPNGKPTRQAIERMQAATFHAAYGDPELVNLMAQATDPESRNLIGGMSRAAGAMAKLKDAGPLDVRDLVTGAAKQIINAVRSGVSIKKFLKQGDLLTSGPEDAIAHFLAENVRSAKAIGERLSHMADFALKQSQSGGTDMFGEEIPTASREDVLKALGTDSKTLKLWQSTAGGALMAAMLGLREMTDADRETLRRILDDGRSGVAQDGDWKEGDHPRAKNGQFGAGGGSGPTARYKDEAKRAGDLSKSARTADEHDEAALAHWNASERASHDPALAKRHQDQGDQHRRQAQAMRRGESGHAQDAEHWITVHPNGRDAVGQPLLLEGEAGGPMTVKGGAGGKLNGKTLSPGSMSKPRTGTGGQADPDAEQSDQYRELRDKANAASAGANTPEQHDQAAEAHAEAANFYEGDGPGEAEHYRKQAEHESNAALMRYAAAARKAEEATERANFEGTEEAHQAAAGAHAEALTAAYKWARAARRKEDDEEAGQVAYNRISRIYRDRHQAQANEHNMQNQDLRAQRLAASLDEKHKAAEAARETANKEKTGNAHRAAAQAFRDAAQAAQAAGKDAERRGYDYLARSHDQAAQESDVRTAKAKKTAEVAKGPAGTRFQKSTPAEIDAHMRENYGLKFQNGSGAAKAYKALIAERKKGYWDRTAEQRADIDRRLSEARSTYVNSHAYGVRTHTQHDITENSAAAKGQRAVAGHVDQALSDMTARGFDIKAALSNGNVALCAGSTGKAYGHAWQNRQNGGIGYFAISHDKMLKKQDEYERNAAARAARGLPRWTVGHDAHSCIRHELAHALGMQPHINSPAKLSKLLVAKFPDARERRAWVVNNISEYAATNVQETDAELCAMVSSSDYVPGTLPREFEEHVYNLFHKKAN